MAKRNAVIDETPDETAPEDTSVRGALDSAWESQENGDDSPDEIETTPGTTGDETDDDTDPARQPAADDQRVPGAAEPETPESDTPPVSLPPAARAAWKDAPAALKAAITKREKDYEQGIMKYANDAKRATHMDQAMQPFQQYFAIAGQPPPQVVTGLLQTASLLQFGSPQQKAHTAAQLISQFGIPIDILDQLLAGETPKGPDPVDQRIQAAIQPFQHMMTAFEQRQQQERQQEVGRINNEIETFARDPGHEFYGDVRLAMADILDVAHRQGRAMTMEQAYQHACTLDPEIGQLLQVRNKAPTQGQRRAASSVHGSPGGSSAGSEPNSLRSSIEQAWENQGRI